MTHTGDNSRRIITPGQLAALGLLLAGIAVLARWHEGPALWGGALLGIAGVGGYFVQFDTPRGLVQWLLAAVGLCMVFMFGLQLLIGVFA